MEGLSNAYGFLQKNIFFSACTVVGLLRIFWFGSGNANDVEQNALVTNAEMML